MNEDLKRSIQALDDKHAPTLTPDGKHDWNTEPDDLDNLESYGEDDMDMHPLANMPMEVRFQCMTRDSEGSPRDYELTIKVNSTDDLKTAVQWVANNVPVANWIQEQQSRNDTRKANEAVQNASFGERGENSQPQPELEERSRVIEAMRLVRETSKNDKEYTKWILYYFDEEDQQLKPQGKFGTPTWDDFAEQIRAIVPEQYRPDDETRMPVELPSEYHFKAFYTTPSKQRKEGGSYKVTQFHRAETIKPQRAPYEDR